MATINGTNGNDTLSGGSENDKLNGKEGDDRLYGSDGSDILYGGDGNDRLFGGGDVYDEGTNVLNGGGGDDYILSGGHQDSITGGDGNDTVEFYSYYSDYDYLVGASLGTSISGGAGVDTLIFNGAIFNASSGSASFSGFEAVSGQLAGRWTNDVLDLSSLTSSALSDDSLHIYGGAGDDRITGGAEQDYIYGDERLEGYVEYYGEQVNDVLSGGGGDDHIYGGVGTNVLNGGLGNDTIYSDGIYDNIAGEAGDDMVVFTSGAILGGTTAGGAGTDTLEFRDATFDAGSGALSFSSFEAMSSINHNIRGTTGNDVLNLSSLASSAFRAATLTITSGAGNDSITGGVEQDTIYGGGGTNMLNGGGGNDTIHSAGVADSISGGEGDDTIIFVTGVILGGATSGGAGIDTVFLDDATFDASSGPASFSSIENLSVNGSLQGTTGNDLLDLSSLTSSTLRDDTLIISGGAGNDSITGGVEQDTIYGNTGTNVLNGGAGNDTIYSEGVDDSINGGDGDDMVVLTSGAILGGTIAGGTGIDTLLFDDAIFDASSGSARFSGFEALSANTVVRGTIGNDMLDLSGLTAATLRDASLIITGGYGNDSISGGMEQDNLYGDGGHDILNGGGGDDSIDGGSGNDMIDGGVGDDILDGGSGVDTLSYASLGNAVSVSLKENQNLSHDGGAGTDIISGFERLIGSAFNDVLGGDDGNNMIDGGAGADVMAGGLGNDLYTVDNAGDQVVEASGGGGNDVIHSRVSFNLAGSFVETLMLTGVNNISATGNSQTNTLIGNDGNNVLNGGGGVDALTGGLGQDEFRFTTAPGAANMDSIGDFTVADDTVALSRSIFAAAGLAGTLAIDAFWTGGAAHDATDRIIYDSGTGKLFYDADGDGANAAVQFAQLSAGLALTNADFLIL